MAPKTKIYGRSLPSVVDDGSSICVTLTFPNILQYRAAFYGAIGELGKWFGWAHTQEDYSDPPTKNLEVAQLWSMVLANAQWGTCGMDCATLASLIDSCPDVRDMILAVMMDGIQNNPVVQGAFENWLIGSESVRNEFDQRYNGPSLNDSVSSGNFLKPSECGEDYLFNQTTVLVDLLDSVTEDMFQAIEVGTNQLERWSIFSSAIPASGQIIPIDEGLAFINQLVEEMHEDYTGAFNLTLRDKLRCELFCVAKDGCSLSLDEVIEYYEQQITGISLEDPATTLQQIATFIASGDFPGDLPVYLAHMLVLTLVKLAQDVFGINFAALSLQVVAAGDTPNNDWELICETCPTEICVDLTTGANGWFGGLEGGVPDTDFGVWISGEGMSPDPSTGGFNVGINAGDMPVGNIKGLKFRFNEPILDSLYLARWGSDAFQVNSDVSDEIVYTPFNTVSYFPFDSTVNSVRITSPTNIMPTSLRLIEVCYLVG